MSTLAIRLGFDRASAFAVRSSIAAAMVIAEPTSEIVYNFRLWPTFAGKCQQRVITMRPRRGICGRVEGGTLVADIGFWKRAQIELAYFSLYARLKARQSGGAGVILRFERVRPQRRQRFQP